MAHKRVALCAIVALFGLTAAGPILPAHHQRLRANGEGARGEGRSSNQEWSQVATSFDSAVCSEHDSVFQAGQTYFFKYTATVESTLGDRAPIFESSSSSSAWSSESGLPWETSSKHHTERRPTDNEDNTEEDPTMPTGEPLPKVASLITCKVELAMSDACKAQLYVPSCKVLEQAPTQANNVAPVALLVARQHPNAEQHEQLVREAFTSPNGEAKEDNSGKSKQLSALVSRYPVKVLLKHGQVAALKVHKHEATIVLNIKRAILDTLQFNKARLEQQPGTVDSDEQQEVSISKKEKSVFGECPTKYTTSANGGIKIEKNLSKCTKLHKTVSGKSKCFAKIDAAAHGGSRRRESGADAPISVVCVEKQVFIGSYNNSKMTPMQPVILTTRSITADTQPSSSSSSSSSRDTEASNEGGYIRTTLAYEAVDEFEAADQLAKVLDTESNQRILSKIETVLEKLVQITLNKDAVTPKTADLFLELLEKIKTVKTIEPLVNELFAQCPAKLSAEASVQCPLEQKIKRDYLLQALIQTPTKAAMQAVTALIQNDQIERTIYEPLLYTAAFMKFIKQQVSTPFTGSRPAVTASYEYLTRMVEMCQQKPTRYCVLSLSTIVHEIYTMLDIDDDTEEKPTTPATPTDIPEPVQRAVQFLLQLIEPQSQCRPSAVLRRAHELTEIDTILLALKAWGNAGDVLEAIVPEFAEQYVVPCIKRFTQTNTASSGSYERPTAARRGSEEALSRKQRRFEATSEPAEDNETDLPEDGEEDVPLPSGQYPLNVTISAVFALRRTTPTEQIKHLLFDLVLNERVPVEPRIAATIQLTRFLAPEDTEIISHLLQTVRTSVVDAVRDSSSPSGSSGSTTHVLSFIASHWKNVLRSTDPYYKPIAEVITKIEPKAYEILRQVERKITQQRRGTYSRAYEMSLFYELPFPVPSMMTAEDDEPATVGFQYEQSWFFTPHSYLPTFVLTNFSLGTFGPYFNAFEIGVDLSDIERQLERTFGRQSAALIPVKQAFGFAYNLFNRIVSEFEDVYYKVGVNPQQLIQKVVRVWQEYKTSGKLYGKKFSAHQLQTMFFSAMHAVQTGDKEPLIREVERFVMPMTSGSSSSQPMDVRQVMHKIELAAKRLMAIPERPMTKEDLIEMLSTVGIPPHMTSQLVDTLEQKLANGQSIDTLLRAIQTFDVERIAMFIGKVVDATVLKKIERALQPLLAESSDMDRQSQDIVVTIQKLLTKISRTVSRFNVGINVKVAGNEIVYFNIRELVHLAFEKVPRFIVKQQKQWQQRVVGGQEESIEMFPMMNIKLIDFSMPIPTAAGLHVATGGVKTVLSTAVKTSFVTSDSGSEGGKKEFLIKTKPSFALTNEVILLKVGLPGIFGAKLSSKMSLSHKSDFGLYGKKPTTHAGNSGKKSLQFGFVLPEEPVTLLQLEQKLVHKIGSQEREIVGSSSSSPQTKRICTPQPLERVTMMRTCVELSSPSQLVLNTLESIGSGYSAYGREMPEEDEEPIESGRRNQRRPTPASEKFASSEADREDDVEDDDTTSPAWSTSGAYTTSKKMFKKYAKLYKALIVGPTKLRLVVTPKPQIRNKALILIAKADKTSTGAGFSQQEDEEELPASGRRAPHHHAAPRRSEEDTTEDFSSSSTVEAVDFKPTDEFTIKLVLKDVAHLVEKLASSSEQSPRVGRPSSSRREKSERRPHTTPYEEDDEDDEDTTPPPPAFEEEPEEQMPSSRHELSGEDDSSEGKPIATGRVYLNRYKKAIVVELKLKKFSTSKTLILLAKPQSDKTPTGKAKGYKIALQVVDKESGERRVAPCEIFAHIVVKKSGRGFEVDDESSTPFPEEQQEDVEEFNSAPVSRRAPRSHPRSSPTEEDTEEEQYDTPSTTTDDAVKPEANITFTYGIRMPKKLVWIMKNSLLKKHQKVWAENELEYGVSGRAMPQSLRFIVEKSKELLLKLKQASKRAGFAVAANIDDSSLYGGASESTEGGQFKSLKIKVAYGVDTKKPTAQQFELVDEKTKAIRFFWLVKTYKTKSGAYIPEPLVILVHDFVVDAKSLKYVKMSSKAVWKNLLKSDGSMSLAKIEWKWHNKSDRTSDSIESDTANRKMQVDYSLTIETPLAVADVYGAMLKKPSRNSDEASCQSSHRAGIVFAPLMASSSSSSSVEPEEDDDVTPVPPMDERRPRRSHHTGHREPHHQFEEEETVSGRGLRKERVPLRIIIGDIDEELTKLRRGKALIVERFPRQYEAQQQLTKFNVSIVTVSTSSSSGADAQEWFSTSPSRRQHHEIDTEQRSPMGPTATQFNTELLISVKPAGQHERIVQAIHMTTNVEAKMMGKSVLKMSSLNVSNRERRQFDDEAIVGADAQGELLKIAFDTVGTLSQHRIPDEELAQKQQQQPFKFVVPPTGRGSSSEQGSEDIVMSGLFKIHAQRGLITRLHIDTALPSLKALSPMSPRRGEEQEPAMDKSKKVRIQQFMELCPTRQKFIVSLNVTSPIVHLKSYGQLTKPFQAGSEMYWHSESEPRDALLRSTSPITSEVLASLLSHRADVYGKIEQSGDAQTTLNFEHDYLMAQSDMRARFVPVEQLLRQILQKSQEQRVITESALISKWVQKAQQAVDKVVYLRKIMLPTNVDMTSTVLVKNAAQPELHLKLTTHKLHLKSEISLKTATQQQESQKLIIEVGKPVGGSETDTTDKLKFIAKIKHIPSEKSLALKIELGPKRSSSAEEEDVEEEQRTPSGGPRIRRQQQQRNVEDESEEENFDTNKKVLSIVLEQTGLAEQQQQKSKLVKIELSLKKKLGDEEREEESEDDDEDSEDYPPTTAGRRIGNTKNTKSYTTSSAFGSSDKKLVIKMLVKPAPLLRTAVAVQKSTFKTALKLVDVALPDETIENVAQKVDQLVKEPRNPLAKLSLKIVKVLFGIKAEGHAQASLEDVVNIVIRRAQHTPAVKLAAHFLDVAPEQITPWTLFTHTKNMLASNPLQETLLKSSSVQPPEMIEQIIRNWDRVLQFVAKAIDMTAGRYARSMIVDSEDSEIVSESRRGGDVSQSEIRVAEIVRKMLKQNKKQIKQILYKLKAMSAKPENMLVLPFVGAPCVAVKKANELEVSSVVKALIKITFASLEQIKRDTLRVVKFARSSPSTMESASDETEMPTAMKSIDLRKIGDKLIKLIPNKLPTCSSRYTTMMDKAWATTSGRRNNNEEEQDIEVSGSEDQESLIDSRQAIDKIIKLIDWISTIAPIDIEVENVPQQEALKVKAEMPIAAKQIKKIVKKIEKILTRMSKKYQQSSFGATDNSFVGAEEEDDQEEETDLSGGQERQRIRGEPKRTGGERRPIDMPEEEEEEQDNTAEEHQRKQFNGQQQQQLKKRSLKH